MSDNYIVTITYMTWDKPEHPKIEYFSTELLAREFIATEKENISKACWDSRYTLGKIIDDSCITIYMNDTSSNGMGSKVTELPKSQR